MSQTLQFTSQLIRLDSSVWGLAFIIPRKISDQFRQSKHKRFIYNFNGSKDIHRTMMPKGDNEYFVYVSKDLMKELKIKLNQVIEISIRPDLSEYGMEMPEEMMEALLAYPQADEYFHQLTPGKQRTLIYQVANLKRVESRVKKAVQILEYLEAYNGKLDFKELNKWYKMSNSR